eukprot:637347-Rhodomonas_salina.1
MSAASSDAPDDAGPWIPPPDRPKPMWDGDFSPPPRGWRWRPDIYIGDAAPAGVKACKQVFERPGDAAAGAYSFAPNPN